MYTTQSLVLTFRLLELAGIMAVMGYVTKADLTRFEYFNDGFLNSWCIGVISSEK